MLKQLWAPWRLEYIEQADERPGCIFCEPEPELVLARDEHAFLLLNRFPYSSGHVMAAPVRHVGDYGDLTDGEVLEIHGRAFPTGRGSVVAIQLRTRRGWRTVSRVRPATDGSYVGYLPQAGRYRAVYGATPAPAVDVH